MQPNISSYNHPAELPLEILDIIWDHLDKETQKTSALVCSLWRQNFHKKHSNELINKALKNPSISLPILGQRLSEIWTKFPKLAKRILMVFLIKIKPLSPYEKLFNLHSLLKTQREKKELGSPLSDYLYKSKHSSNDLRLALNGRYFEFVPADGSKPLHIMGKKVTKDVPFKENWVPPELIKKLQIHPYQVFEPEELVAIEDEGFHYGGKTSIFFGKVIRSKGKNWYLIQAPLSKIIERQPQMIGKIPADLLS